MQGRDFQKILQDQIDAMGLEIREERIDSIYAMGDSFTACVNETMYEARAVILAVGVSTAGAVDGTITLNGQDLAGVRLADLRGRSAYVLQNTPLLAGTIRENLIYGARTQPDDAAIEATASLDHRTAGLVLDHLLDGRVPTVVYISHNMEEVRRADHVIVLRQGRVEASGTPVWDASLDELAAWLVDQGVLESDDYAPLSEGIATAARSYSGLELYW